MVRRSFFLILALAGWVLADTGFQNTIQVTETDNSPKCQAGQLKVSAGTLTCSGQTATISTGGSGGGGSSSLQVTQSGVQITSPTASINFTGPPFSLTATGSTSTVSLDPSSVTLQGLLPTKLGTVTSGTWQGSVIDDTYLSADIAFVDSTNTFTSNQIITSSGGLNVTYGVVAGSFTGVGSGLTGLTGANITTSISSAVLPSTIAYTNLSNTFTSSQTITSSMSITGAGGVTVTFGVNASTFVGNGASLTNLTGSNIVSGISSSILPSSVAYVSSTQTWTAYQNFVSSVTHGGAVYISSTVVLNGSPGVSGQVLTTGGNGAIPSWQTPSAGGGGSSTLGLSSGSAVTSVVVSSPTSNIVVDSNTFVASLQGSTSAFLQLNSSSVTLQGNNLSATYLTNSSATATYLQLSSATATYLQQSSATATYLQLSSATATYLNKNQATNGTVTSVTGTAPIASSGGNTPAISLNQLIAQQETFSSSVTLTSSETVSGAGGVVVSFGVNASTFVGNGSGLTSLTGSNITTGIASAVLPSTIAYTSVSNTFTSSQTITSSMSVTGAGGVTVSFGVNASTFVGGGAGITSLTGSNITTGIPSAVLPSSVAYLSSTQTWTAYQNFTSSVTHGGAIYVSSTVVLNGAPGSNGQVLTSGGNGAIPSWQTPTTGSGGSSALGVSSGSATTSIVVSSPTSNIVVDSNTFIASLQGSTSSFLQLNSSSVTLQTNTFNRANRLLMPSNVGTPGQILTAVSTTSAPTWQPALYINPGFLIMAHGGPIFAVNTSSYLAIGNTFMNNLSTTEVEAQIPFHSSGTISRLWVQVHSNTLTGGTTVYLRINGKTVNSTVIIPGNQLGEFQDSGNIDRVNVNDKVDYLIKTPPSGSGAIQFLGVSILFQANFNNVMKMVGTGDPANTITSGVATFYTAIAGELDTADQFESTQSYKLTTAGYFANMGIYVSTNTRPDTTTIRFRKNNANGNQVISIPPNSTGLFEDNVNTDFVVVGDTVDYSIVMGGNGSANPFVFNWIGSEFTTTGISMDYQAIAQTHNFAPADNNYLSVQGFGGLDNAEVNDMQVRSQAGMLCSNLHVYLTTSSLTVPLTIVFRKNNADGLQKLVIPSGAWGYFEDAISSHTDFVAPYDDIDWHETVPAGSGTAPYVYVGMTCQFTPTFLPGGRDTQVLFADQETTAGSPLFTFNKSSGTLAVTYGVVAGTFTSTASGSIFTNGAASSDNDTIGIVDIFKSNTTLGDVLLGIGSNNQVNQFQVKDQSPLALTVYGASLGGLQAGLSGHGAEIYSVQAGAGAQGINYWNGGEMDLQTATAGSGGLDIVMKPQNVESERFSNTSGTTVTSSETIKGAGGLGVLFGVKGSSLTANSSYIQFFSRSVAQIAAIVPLAVGEAYYCNNCTALTLCVSTGTLVGAFASPTAKTTACN